MKRTILAVASTCALAGVFLPADRATPRSLDGTAAADASRDAERQAMVRTLRARGIRDARVLDAMGAVPRHHFVPEPFQRDAYAETPLPIGHGQTLSEPYVVALMAEAVRPRGEERVLEVGSGSGYAAAVLSLLGREVYGIELEPELCERSIVALRALGRANVHVRCGDGFAGWRERAPFDAIVISCAVEAIPAPLWQQLADGGRVTYPRGAAEGVQELVVVTKTPDGAREERLASVRFVPMRRGP
jgi:protein-L-isoaspartate(D-aspartate) O-methyltransferase